ncbi:hypothetical protein [Desertibacillus haloalkaliphilus]|uniref:hypothetical protein n=1 Tax=Desertibacillus haloalkaliphilus TaxID=1328930 RepID=UPI001C25689B|nr:hypothetical protein [Desertibacillus haloalkaliphilus]MBU8905240.1 hypothetical protein [Desertibacillus haloalkaliphilus]
MKKRIIGISFLMVATFVIGLMIALPQAEEHLSSTTDEDIDLLEANQEMTVITMAIIEELEEYETIGDIKIDYLEAITIETEIDRTEPNAKHLSEEITKSIDLLQLNKRHSLEAYEVTIVDKNGDPLD